MAKTFKNIPRASEPAAPKPTSERDFFDLSDDHSSVKKPAEQSGTVHNIGNTNNTANEVSGNSTLAPVVTTNSSAQDGVRQTFVLSRGHLEQLRDYVHARRAQGDYNYSQKQALQEALDLLFASTAPAAPRPAYAREQEAQRRQRIQRGRQSGISG